MAIIPGPGPDNPDDPIVYEAVVTVEQLHSFMGEPDWGDLDDPDNSVVKDVESTLRGLQSKLEIYLNRPVQPIYIREQVTTDWNGVMNLSVTPVHRIVSFREVGFGGYVGGSIGQPISKTPLSAIDEDIRTVDKWGENNDHGIIVPGGVYLGSPGWWYVVEYIGGYVGYWDEGVREGIKEVAARTATRNHDDTINFREDKADEAQPKDKRPRGWTKEELEQFDRLRRRVVA